MLYYHNIWLSYGTWTETTPRFVTFNFTPALLIVAKTPYQCDVSAFELVVPAQKHWLHSDVN